MKAPTSQDKSIWPAIATMLRLLPKASRGFTAAAVALLLMEALLPTAFRIATGALVGTLPAAVQGGAGSDAAHRVDVLLVVLGVTFIAQQVVGPLSALSVDALGRRLNGHLRARVMAAAALPPGIGHLEDPATLDKVMLAQGVGSSYVTPRNVVNGVFNIASNYVAGTAAAILLMAYRWWLPVVIVAAYLLVIKRFRREFHRNVQAITGKAETLRRSAYFRDVALTPAAAKETRVFGMADWVVERFRESWHGAMVDMWRERRGQWKTMVLSGVVFFVAEFGALLMLAHSAITGEISLGRLVVFMAALGGLGAFANLSDHDLNITFGAPAITAAIELEDLVRTPSVALRGDQPADGLPAQRGALRRRALRVSGPRRRVRRSRSRDPGRQVPRHCRR